jgi:hypothetical protein
LDAPARIEFLYFADCPSHPEALALLRRVLEERHLEPEVEVREVRTDEEARALAFAGARPALTCRIYRLPDGRVSPLPTREQIEEALT